MKMLDQEWSADPTQPGRISAGDAITVDVRVAFWRVPGSDVGGWSSAEAMRLVKETEALVVAAPDMARALLALLTRPDGCPMCDEGVLRKGVTAHWPECPYPAARSALAKAGVPLP